MRNGNLRSVYKELPIWERVLLVLRNWQDGQPADPDFLIGIDPEEAWRFNHYIDLMNRSQDLLGMVAVRLEVLLSNLDVRFGALVYFNLWEDELWSLADEVEKVVKESQSSDRKLVREVRRVFRAHSGGGGPRATAKQPGVQRRMLRAENLLAVLKEAYGYVSSQLLAAEQVAAELREEFRGEDPLHPVVSHALDNAREGLDDLSEGLKAYGGELPPSELDEDLVEALREGIWQGAGGQHVLSRAPTERREGNRTSAAEPVTFTFVTPDARQRPGMAQTTGASASAGEKAK